MSDSVKNPVKDPETAKKYIEKIGTLPKPASMVEPYIKKEEINPFTKMLKKPKEIHDKDGNPVEVPKLLMDDGWDLAYKCKQLIDQLKSNDWTTLLDEIMDLEDGKEKVLDIVSLILKKDVQWVKENIPFDEMEVLIQIFLLPRKVLKSKASVISLMQRTPEVSEAQENVLPNTSNQ